jgi:hypothetical protein
LAGLRSIAALLVSLAAAGGLLLPFTVRPVAADHLCGGFLNHTGGGLQTTSTSTTRHTTFITSQAPGGPTEQFRTRVIAVIGQTTVFDETVESGLTFIAVAEALDRARAAIRAQLGPLAVITGPEQTQSNRTQVSQNPTNQVTHTETAVTNTTSFGPTVIQVGPDQSITCFIAAGTTNLNINTHTETFVNSVIPAPGFLTFTELRLTGSGQQFVKPQIPQLQQIPFIQSIFTNRSRNNPKTPLQIFITPNIIRPTE